MIKEKFGSVRYQMLRVLMYRRNGKDGILSDVSMPMIKTGASGRDQWLNDFGFSQFAQEAESVATNIFVRMLEVVSDPIAVYDR